MAITVEEARAMLADLTTTAVTERREAIRGRLEKGLAGALGAYDALGRDVPLDERLAALRAIVTAADALAAFDAKDDGVKR